MSEFPASPNASRRKSSQSEALARAETPEKEVEAAKLTAIVQNKNRSMDLEAAHAEVAKLSDQLSMKSGESQRPCEETGTPSKARARDEPTEEESGWATAYIETPQELGAEKKVLNSPINDPFGIVGLAIAILLLVIILGSIAIQK
jgi:hypothetical protein